MTQAHVGVTASFWVMGVLWSLWHVPAFFDRTMPHYSGVGGAKLTSGAFCGRWQEGVRRHRRRDHRRHCKAAGNARSLVGDVEMIGVGWA